MHSSFCAGRWSARREMPRQRNIEEEFQAIAPQGWQGSPAVPPLAVGLSGGAESRTYSSQASQDITLLEAQFRQQTTQQQKKQQTKQKTTTTDRRTKKEDIG